jgi:hypothetical protein
MSLGVSWKLPMEDQPTSACAGKWEQRNEAVWKAGQSITDVTK